ncbi:MAG: NADH-quinone oxidoreductase subunit L [Verrucomicrobiota bacterium]
MNWLILLPPLLAAIVITLFTRPFPKLSSYISIAACLVSAVGSGILLFSDQASGMLDWEWMNLPGLRITIGAMGDPLARMMLVVVTWVGLLIHFFSLGYMAKDPGKARFFAQLSLFMFSMIGIVLANNLVMMFIFWELVGLSSYLLIGFWFQRPAAAEASKKAFIVNRVGDFGFLLGILGVWATFGTVDFAELEKVISNGVGANPITQGGLMLMALGLFMGCMGKSAQFPLHVWLPDAMEGPTPVSALIHAATMVAAGVYMLCRVFFILDLSPAALQVIAWIGMGTALFAAVIATRQNDIKRILAYSTLSQLGYMVSAVGMAGAIEHPEYGTTAAMYHLTTHAFFKALLFLGAGSVIHSLHHEQNIWKMGGLIKKMPVTGWTFVIGTLALMGCPYITAGFWSKEAILAVALEANPVLCILGFVTALLTSFYMTRLVIVAFFGQPRGDEVEHAHESPLVMTVPLVLLAIPSLIAGYLHIDQFIAGGKVEHHVDFLLLGGSFVVFAGGLAAGWYVYWQKNEEPLTFGFLKLAENKFYFDELYAATIVRGQDLLAQAMAWFDQWIIGAVLVRGVGATAGLLGQCFRLFQNGMIQTYAWIFLLGVLLLCLVMGVLS